MTCDGPCFAATPTQGRPTTKRICVRARSVRPSSFGRVGELVNRGPGDCLVNCSHQLTNSPTHQFTNSNDLYRGVSYPMIRGFCPARLSVIACETTTENSGRISLRVYGLSCTIRM